MGEEGYATLVLELTKHYQTKYNLPYEHALTLAIGCYAYSQGRST